MTEQRQPPAFDLAAYRLRTRDPDVMSVDDLARYLGVARNTAYMYLADGTIPARKLGSRWIVSRARVAAWVAGMPVHGKGA